MKDEGGEKDVPSPSGVGWLLVRRAALARTSRTSDCNWILKPRRIINTTIHVDPNFQL